MRIVKCVHFFLGGGAGLKFWGGSSPSLKKRTSGNPDYDILYFVLLLDREDGYQGKYEVVVSWNYIFVDTRTTKCKKSYACGVW